MMIIIFWEMTPCGSYKTRRFGGSYRLHLQGARVRVGTERSSKLLYRQRSSETSVLIRATRRHLPEDYNHHHVFMLKLVFILIMRTKAIRFPYLDLTT
jgi:hypothetical protein